MEKKIRISWLGRTHSIAIKISNKFKYNSQLFVITFMMVCLCFHIYLQPHFSPDGYSAYNLNDYNMEFMLGLGRPFNALIMKLLYLAGINPVKFQSIFCMLMLIVFTISIVKIYNIIDGINSNIDIFTKILIYICTLVAFLNVFFAEWYQFSEAYVMFSGALLFVVLSIQLYSDSKYLMSSLFLFIALGFYQGVLGIFINWTLAIIYLRNNRHIGKLLKHFSLCIFISGIASALNILSNKILTVMNIAATNERQATFKFEILFHNIKEILQKQSFFLINGYNFLPSNFLLFCLVLLLILFCIVQYKKIYVLWIFPAVLYGSTFLPFLVSGVIWMSQRTVVSYFSIFSILAIVILLVNENVSRHFIATAVTVVMSSMLLLNVKAINKIAIDLFSTNNMDFLICKQIENEISVYEEESGFVVNKILVQDDLYPVYSYPNISTQVYDTNIRALKVQWCLKDLFKYVMNRDFEVELMDEMTSQRLFMNENWDEINIREQLRFEENILYLMLY